jgi:hypothetical protein
MFFNILNPIANMILNGEELKLFPLKSEMRQGCPLFPSHVQYCFRIPSQSNNTRARNKLDSNKEGRSQTTLFADDMILYLKDPNNSTKNIEIINSLQSSRIQN